MCSIRGESMRKENTLKYLILTFVMAVTFFMFSRVPVKAVETVNIQGNLSFELESINSDNLSEGYKIVRVVDSCEGIEDCTRVSSLETLSIPDSYNGYPVVSIGDGSVDVDTETAIKTFKGTLDKLKDVSITKISGGNNLVTIGTCAFCNLAASEVVLSSSVVNIGDYAFSKSQITKVYIN